MELVSIEMGCLYDIFSSHPFMYNRTLYLAVSASIVFSFIKPGQSPKTWECYLPAKLNHMHRSIAGSWGSGSARRPANRSSSGEHVGAAHYLNLYFVQLPSPDSVSYKALNTSKYIYTPCH